MRPLPRTPFTPPPATPVRREQRVLEEEEATSKPDAAAETRDLVPSLTGAVVLERLKNAYAEGTAALRFFRDDAGASLNPYDVPLPALIGCVAGARRRARALDRTPRTLTRPRPPPPIPPLAIFSIKK